MNTQKYNLSFTGYYSDKDKSKLPTHSGIYCVYAGDSSLVKGEVAIAKLIYIGESENIKDRVVSHGQYNDWKTI